jgi:CarD family transcriptional regulator
MSGLLHPPVHNPGAFLRIPIGTYLVHPVHGPTVLVEVTTRMVSGVETEYAVLEHVEQDLVLQLPLATLEDHELRPAMEPDEAMDVLAVFDEPAGGQEMSWRRMRARNQAKMMSGVPKQLAEVVRDLAAKREAKGISSSERTLMRRARARLESELDLAVDADANDLVAAKLKL